MPTARDRSVTTLEAMMQIKDVLVHPLSGPQTSSNDQVLRSDLPADNFVVSRIPKRRRTVDNPHPKTDDLSQDIASIFSFFEEPWVQSQFTYAAAYSQAPASSLLELPNLEYEDDRLGSKKTAPSSPAPVAAFRPPSQRASTSIPNDLISPRSGGNVELESTERLRSMVRLFEPHSSQAGIDNRANRRANRLPLCWLLAPSYKWEPHEVVLGKRAPPSAQDPNDLYDSMRGTTSIFVRAKSLHFDIGQNEPFFLGMSLWDVNAKKKISEDFFFHLNDEIILLMLGNRGAARSADSTAVDRSTQARTCLFRVTQAQRTSAIFLVVTIFKVYSPHDPENVVEPYTVSNTEKDKKKFTKALAAIKGAAQETCSRFGAYRQPFAWGYMPMFAPSGELIVGSSTRLNTIYFLPPKQQILPLLEQQNDPKIRQTWRELPGFFLFDAAIITKPNFSTLYDPSLRLVALSTPNQQVPPAPSSSGASSAAASSSPVPSVSLENVSASDPDAFLTKDHSKYLDPTIGTGDDSEGTKEIAAFNHRFELQPHTSFKNLLWVSPLSLNYSSRTKYNNLLLRVALKEDDDDKFAGLPVFFSQEPGPERRRFLDTTVTHHSRNPVFTNEFKVELPIRLTAKHHLLITVWNINLKKKKDGDELETLTGYAVLPLYSNGLIASTLGAEVHPLPVVSAHAISAGYMTEVNPETIQYVDGGKPILQVALHLESTLFPQDRHLSALFKVFHFKEFFRDDELTAALEELPSATPELLVQYFPIVMNMLMTIMCTRSQQGDGPALLAFKTMLLVASTVHTSTKPEDGNSSDSTAYLSRYVSTMFAIPPLCRVPPHTTLARNFFCLCSMLKHGGVSLQLAQLFQVASFIFQLIVKSLILKIDSSAGTAAASTNTGAGNAEAGEAFKYVKELVIYLTKNFVLQKSADGREDPAALNRDLALFISDLFSCFNSMLMSELVCAYLDLTFSEIESSRQEILPVLQFEFLDLLTDNYHFITLCRPPLPGEVDLSIDNLEGYYANRFPLATGVCSAVLRCLESRRTLAWNRSLKMFNSLVSKHDWDARFSEGPAKEQIAAMYFIFIHAHVKNAAHFAKFRGESKFDFKLFFYPFLWILKHIDRNLLRSWWRNQSEATLIYFLDLLQDCIRCYEYDPLLRFMKSAIGVSEQSVRILSAYGCTEVNLIILDLLEDLVEDYENSLSLLDARRRPSKLMKKIFTVFLYLLLKRQSSVAHEHIFSSLRGLVTRFPDLVFFAQEKYCKDLLLHVLPICGSLIRRTQITASAFFYLLLKLNNLHNGEFLRFVSQAITALSQLTEDTFDQVAAPASLGDGPFITATSITAATSAQALPQQQQKKQMPKLLESKRLGEALTLIQQFVLLEYSCTPFLGLRIDNTKRLSYTSPETNLLYQKARFARSVEEICETLSRLLSDSSLIKEARKQADVYQICDIYLRIANSYRETPSLRLEWLLQLANFLETDALYAEAAVCILHGAALILDFLELPNVDKDILKTICPSMNECADGASASDKFSLSGFLNYMAQAVRLFCQAQLFEYGALLYKLLLPIFEAKSNYSSMAAAHRELQSIWSQVAGATGEKQRYPYTYYRVGFWSKKFGDLHGQTFVYKLPAFRHLFEVTEQLKKQLEKTVGEEVIVWKKGTLNPAELEQDKCYMNIGSVNPYHPDSETNAAANSNTTKNNNKNNTSNSDEFKQSTNVRSFVFVSPFNRGNGQKMTDQFIRRTVLTVANPFPYVVCRQPVISNQETIISPIQSAQDALQAQLRSIVQEFEAKDTKGLERVLQGSVLTTVHQGPVQFGREFLSATARKAMAAEPWPRSDMDKLCDIFRHFLSACEQGLRLHEEFSKGDANAMLLHTELRAGYNQLRDEIQTYLTQLAEDEVEEEEGPSNSATEISERDIGGTTEGGDDSDTSNTTVDQEDISTGPVEQKSSGSRSPAPRRRSSSTRGKKGRSATATATLPLPSNIPT